MSRVGTAVCLLVLFACALSAQPTRFEGKIIRTIQFVPPDQPLDAEEIFRVLPLRVGAPFRAADVRGAIDRLYATGAYVDLQVDADLRGDEVIVRFLTEASWFIGGVFVEGSIKEPPNNGQLVTATRLQLGDAFDEQNVKDAIANLQALLEANGYYENRVTPRYEYRARTQQILVHLQVESGSRATFASPVISGQPPVAAEQLARATRWKGPFGWRPVTQSRLQQGLRHIRSRLQKQDRLMVTVSVEDLEFDSSRQTVTPALKVTSGPTIEVRTIGAKVSKGRLRKYIPIYEESSVDRDLLVEGVRNLRDFFQAEGFFDAEVEFKQQRVVNDRAVIDYLVNLGPRHRLVKVDVDGNRYFDRETLRERMFLLPASLQFRRGRYSEGLRRRDEESIAGLYRENGFRDVKVTSEIEDNFGGRTGDLRVILHVQEGPQWFVAGLEIEGVHDLSRDNLAAILSSSPGQPFSEFNVAVDRDNILVRYFAEGFSNASFEWSSTPAAQPNRVNLKFRIGEGQRRFVRQVLVTGLETTRPDLVNRNIGLAPGDPLSPIQMAETQRRMYDLGVFARVNMAIQNPEGDSDRKYVLYDVEEARKYSVTGGVGAEFGRFGGSPLSLQNPAGAAGFNPRVSADLSRLNFRGLGHSINLKSRLSSLNQRALVNYNAPRIGNHPGTNLTFTALLDNSLYINTFTSRRREGSVQLSQRLSKANTALFRFSYRRVTVSNVKVIQLPLLFAPARVGIASASFVQDRRDDPIDSHKGVYNTVDFGYASKLFGSQVEFTRLLARNATYHPFGKRLVVARTATFGWLLPIRLRTGDAGDIQEIPLAERFFSGGSNSHRGFPENQAGPRDPTTGFPLGGQAVVQHNVEARFPLIGNTISGVLFHDAGNVYSEIEKISFRVRQRNLEDFNYMVHAIGFGIRYRTPIGPVRLDLAYGPNSPRFNGCANTEDQFFRCEGRLEQRISRFQFHFSIGQAF